MPKVIELTVELDVQRVSCPGVWLCQDGRVSLSVFTLGSSYQTCLLPPSFPLDFKDVFFFRKKFEEACVFNNMCCLLKNESIYCELVQWCEDCRLDDCTVLAQYVGSLNDILFPSKMCSNEGVDLLMRRTPEFPGILSPKIEIATKVRIDELFVHSNRSSKNMKPRFCACKAKPELDGPRQKQVCHTPLYHRIRCLNKSGATRSSCSLKDASNSQANHLYNVPRPTSCRYAVHNLQTTPTEYVWQRVVNNERAVDDDSSETRDNEVENDLVTNPEERLQRINIYSQRIDDYCNVIDGKTPKRRNVMKIHPCECEICRKYHELFHSKPSQLYMPAAP